MFGDWDQGDGCGFSVPMIPLLIGWCQVGLRVALPVPHDATKHVHPTLQLDPETPPILC